MFVIHLPEAAEQVQARRRHEARLQHAHRHAVRVARAQHARPGRMRQAVAFRLIEAGLRLLSARSAARHSAQEHPA